MANDEPNRLAKSTREIKSKTRLPNLNIIKKKKNMINGTMALFKEI